MSGQASRTPPRFSMTRDQVFSFAAWLLRERAMPSVTAWDEREKAAYRSITEQFFAALHPRGKEGAGTYGRLAAGADPALMRMVVGWLALRSAHRAAPWAFERAWAQYRRVRDAATIRPRTAVPPNPWLKTVTPSDVWEAMGELVEKPLGVDLLGPDDARLIVEAAIEDWRRRTLEVPHHVPCPACSVVDVNPLIAAHHVPRCPAHPALKRLRAAHDAADLARSVIGQLGLLPRREMIDIPVPASRIQPNEIGTGESLNDLEKLVACKRGDPTPDLTHLRVLLTEWEHLVDRSTDPCPDCGKVMPLEAMIDHMLGCERHPANRAAATLHAWLLFTFGTGTEAVIALITERTELREELRLLSAATEDFAGDLHWGRDEGTYSKPGDEESWMAARSRAARLLGYSTRRPEPVEQTSELRDALKRALGTLARRPGEPSPSHDLALLSGALELVEQVIRDHGLTMSCPACRRPGVPPAALHDHLLGCRALPANARARQAAAELNAQGRRIELPESASAPIDRLDPREWLAACDGGDRGKFLERWHRSEREALARLAEGKTPLSDDGWMLERVVRIAEDIGAASNATCPGCGLLLGIPNAASHLMACQELPAARFAREAEQSFSSRERNVRFSAELSPASIRAECDQLALLLARLEDANGGYWSAMRDGDGGRSIEDARQVTNWEAARAAAKAAVAAAADRHPNSR